MHATWRRVTATFVAVLALAALVACSSGDGTLARLRSEPVWTLEVPGTTVQDVVTRDGGSSLGQRVVAKAAKTLVPGDGTTTTDVVAALTASAEDSGWTDPTATDGSVTWTKVVDGVTWSLYVGEQDDGVRLSLDAS
ncbi:hypothetical protein GXP71_03075 [Cellulomonas sp. H30R-01]|uniref:hypothetical protein n=1 Tax=Cellulomonas sp. H30R-01 TaxID=2704467 RepID=UPI00138D9337|nr:hypothetical protein [Cellulomonas sp. H30R-01]QHT55169.1 hypothetical protein GXP71_03075 [Cellulomonas sp. H30R-01]